jgi:hypothetical protein
MCKESSLDLVYPENVKKVQNGLARWARSLRRSVQTWSGGSDIPSLNGSSGWIYPSLKGLIDEVYFHAATRVWRLVWDIVNNRLDLGQRAHRSRWSTTLTDKDVTARCLQLCDSAAMERSSPVRSTAHRVLYLEIAFRFPSNSYMEPNQIVCSEADPLSRGIFVRLTPQRRSAIWFQSSA